MLRACIRVVNSEIGVSLYACIGVVNSDVGAPVFAFDSSHMQLRVSMHSRKLSSIVHYFTTLTVHEPLFFVAGASIIP